MPLPILLKKGLQLNRRMIMTKKIEKPKKAMQYSTGVNRILIKFAKKNKITLSKYIENEFSNQK